MPRAARATPNIPAVLSARKMIPDRMHTGALVRQPPHSPASLHS
jgi:hypothetical protein